MRCFVTLAALLLLSCSGGGEPEISAVDGWTREVAPGQSTAVAYVVISNGGEGSDKLIGAESPVAAEATLHSSSSAGGVARMRRIVDAVVIPGHSRIAFKPGGNHIMLTGLKRTPRAGETAELTLIFELSGRREIAMRVLPATAADGHSHGMKM